MRITKQALNTRWALASLSAAIVYAVLIWWDLRLKALSGYGTADLQGFSTAGQYNDAFRVWPSRYAVRAGFAWGLDYLLMPLYATAFFYSGILAREAFALRGGLLARVLTALSVVPILGAVLDAVENGLQLSMMLTAPSDSQAAMALGVSNAKWIAAYIGFLLLAGALFARVLERRKRALKTGP
jgi:hypothetical protein